MASAFTSTPATVLTAGVHDLKVDEVGWQKSENGDIRVVVKVETASGQGVVVDTFLVYANGSADEKKQSVVHTHQSVLGQMALKAGADEEELNKGLKEALVEIKKTLTGKTLAMRLSVDGKTQRNVIRETRGLAADDLPALN